MKRPGDGLRDEAEEADEEGGDRSRGQGRAGKQSERTWGPAEEKEAPRPGALPESQAQHLLGSAPRPMTEVPAWPGCYGDQTKPALTRHSR